MSIIFASNHSDHDQDEVLGSYTVEKINYSENRHQYILHWHGINHLNQFQSNNEIG